MKTIETATILNADRNIITVSIEANLYHIFVVEYLNDAEVNRVETPGLAPAFERFDSLTAAF